MVCQGDSILRKLLQPLQESTYFCRLLAIVFSQAALFTPSSISYFFWSWTEVLCYFSKLRKKQADGEVDAHLKKTGRKITDLIPSHHLKPSLHFSCHFNIKLHLIFFFFPKNHKNSFFSRQGNTSSLLWTLTFALSNILNQVSLKWACCQV